MHIDKAHTARLPPEPYPCENYKDQIRRMSERIKLYDEFINGLRETPRSVANQPKPQGEK